MTDHGHPLPGDDDPVVRRLGAMFDEGESVSPSPRLQWTGIAEVRAGRSGTGLARLAQPRTLGLVAAAAAIALVVGFVGTRGPAEEETTVAGPGGGTTTTALATTTTSVGPATETTAPSATTPTEDPGATLDGGATTTTTAATGDPLLGPAPAPSPTSPPPPVVTPPRTPPINATTTTTAVPAGAAFADDFGADAVGTTDPARWTVASGVWRVGEQGGLHWAKANNVGNPSADSRLVADAGPWAGVTVQARMSIDAGSLGGVLARWQDAGNHAFCVVDRPAGVLRLGIVQGGVARTIAEQPWAIGGWADVTLTLTATGSSYSCAGTPTGGAVAASVTGTDGTFATGRIGLWSRGPGAGLTSVVATP